MKTKKDGIKETIVITIIMLVVFGFIIFGASVSGKASPYQLLKSKILTAKYGETIISACDDFWEKTSVNNSTGTSKGLDDVKFLVLTKYGDAINLHDWQKRIDKEIRAQSSSDHPIVICVNEIEDVIETCWYTNNGVTQTIQDKVNLFFVDFQTGNLLYSVSLIGEMPPGCPNSHSSDKHGYFDNKLFDNELSKFISKLP